MRSPPDKIARRWTEWVKELDQRADGTDVTAVVVEPPIRDVPRDLTRLRPADVAVGALFLWWATYLTWGSGGQDKHVLSVALVLLAFAVTLVRPWERVPTAVFVLLTSIGAAAFGVALTSPTGWRGANEAAAYVFASQLALVVLAWARDAQRRFAVLALLALASLFEFAKGFVQWWSSGLADKVFVGTFYWHNQTGIFLVMGVSVGLLLLLSTARHGVALGFLVVPLCSAGVVFTTSRGSQIALFLAFTAAALVAWLNPRKRMIGLTKVGAAGGSAVVLSQLLTGPPFFAHRVAAAVGEGSRTEGLSQNGGHRLEFWGQAWQVFKHWPLSGAGFHSFASASRDLDSHKAVASAYAHNGFLQLLSDGGLLLAAPVLGAVSLALIAGMCRLPERLRGGDLLQPAAYLGFVLLLLHSGMDFDWSYPTLLSAAAVLGALSVGDLRPVTGPIGLRPWLMTVTSLVLILVGAIAAWHGSILINLPIRGAS